MFKGYIYFLHNGDFQPRYIGKTIQEPRRRMNAHRSDARIGSKLPVHNWMRKHGLDNIQMCLMSETTDASQLDELEQFYITQERAYGNILNVTDGGGGIDGFTHSDAAKAKISAARKGTKNSPEAVAKMSLAKRGQPTWNKGAIHPGGARGMHTRWHTNRNIVNPDCTSCKESK
jgi:group I intron endonuclease